MTKKALITGGSSGIGAEYARQLAFNGYSVILVGRNEEALVKTTSNLPTESEIIKADLLSEDELQIVVDRLRSVDSPVSVLINNAGYGLPLAFEKNDIAEETAHQRLHNEVPMRLMHAVLPVMIENKNGVIINVASVAAFIPRGTYSAVKQWLVTFSRWANAFYKKQGIKVSAVCPGFTHTNFHERMGLPPGQEGIPTWMWINSAEVVKESLYGAFSGKAVVVPTLKYKFIVALTKLLPDAILRKAGETGR